MLVEILPINASTFAGIGGGAASAILMIENTAPADELASLNISLNDIVNQGKRDKKKVCIVGTTSMRAIESSVSTDGYLKPFSGWTAAVFDRSRRAGCTSPSAAAKRRSAHWE